MSFVGPLLVGLLLGAISCGVIIRYSQGHRLRWASVPARVKLPVVAVNAVIYVAATSLWSTKGWASTAGYLLGIAVAVVAGLVIVRRGRDARAP